MTFTEQLPLAFGASGPAVAELQRRLREAGYPTGDDASAQLGAGTQAAVRRFQADHGIPATGIVNDDTWQRVVEAEFQLGQRLLCLVSPMMRGNDVAELQLRLGSMGFDAGRVDGIFGPATQLAVRDFQRNAGLVCDDVCGPDTVQALQRLEGRGGRSTVAGVRERERLRQLRDGLAELRLAVAASAATQAVAVALATTIESVGGATVVLMGSVAEQATASNDFRADVVIGLERTDALAMTATYFEAPGFSSYGGLQLAHHIAAELGALPTGTPCNVAGMQLPLLRETRAPAVVLELSTGTDATDMDQGVVEALSRAIDDWIRHLD